MANSRQVIEQKQVQVLFVTEIDIKLYTNMSSNKVTTSLVNFILLAQDLQIKKILGESLYTKLMNEWVAANYDKNQLPDGTGTIPPIIVGDTINYQQLYEEIRKPLIWWSYVISLPHIAIKVEEAGVMLNSTDYSQSAGMVGLDRLVAEGKAIAQSYTELLKTYICDTFKTDQEVMSESVNVGGVSIGLFVPKRNWSRNRDKTCKDC